MATTKHITYASKDFLVGDQVAELLLEYAAALATTAETDTVHLHAINGTDPDTGEEVDIMLLLGDGAPLIAETAPTAVPEPKNADTVRYLSEQLTGRNSASADDQTGAAGADYDLPYE